MHGSLKFRKYFKNFQKKKVLKKVKRKRQKKSLINLIGLLMYLCFTEAKKDEDRKEMNLLWKTSSTDPMLKPCTDY